MENLEITNSESEEPVVKDPRISEVTETMEDYSNMLDASFRTVEEGSILSGTIISISETEAIVDLKYYAEGILRLEDISNDPSFSILTDLSVGDEISAMVLRKDDGNGNILLSMKDANAILVWDELKALKESGETVSVKIAEIVKGGVVAYLRGIRAFIPASKLSLDFVENLDEWKNKELDVQVITVEEESDKLVLSAKELLKETAMKERSAKISNLAPGLVTEGIVESLQPYGAFVRIGDGLTGLVHISQICEKRIKHPGAVLKEGETVKVKVIGEKDGKISLSMKALQEETAEGLTSETFDLPESDELTTSLGSLFRNLKL